MNLVPVTFDLGNRSGVRGFEAYTQRKLMTESSYNNSLAYSHIWSTIKTLPATLPEPSSRDRGPRGLGLLWASSPMRLCDV